MVENEIEKETVYIGATLKEHREKQDVSIQQVANQLHLDNRIIILFLIPYTYADTFEDTVNY